MVQCKNCEYEIDKRANDQLYTDVCDENGLDGNDGCSECAGWCDECDSVFYREHALKSHESGVTLCRNCWQFKFGW